MFITFSSASGPRAQHHRSEYVCAEREAGRRRHGSAAPDRGGRGRNGGNRQRREKTDNGASRAGTASPAAHRNGRVQPPPPRPSQPTHQPRSHASTGTAAGRSSEKARARRGGTSIHRRIRGEDRTPKDADASTSGKRPVWFRPVGATALLTSSQREQGASLA